MAEPTLEQFERLLRLVRTHFDTKSIEWLLGEDGLLCALGDLSNDQLRRLELDDGTLSKLIAPSTDDAKWSKPSTYPDRFERWNHHFNFGINTSGVRSMAGNRPQSLDTSILYSIGFNFGGPLTAHWDKLMRILQFEIAQYDLTLEVELDPRTLLYRNERNGFDSLRDRVYGTHLTIGEYGDDMSTLTLREVLSLERTWPSFEVLWLLIQNAHILRYMDSDSMPTMYFPGFRTTDNRVPLIGCDGESVCISSISEATLAHTDSITLPAYVRQPSA